MKKPLSLPIHSKHSAIAADIAQIVADALTFLAADPDRLARFFAITGLSADTLRRATRDPGFAESLLDYLASDERTFLAFCAEQCHDPACLEAYRQSLARPLDGG